VIESGDFDDAEKSVAVNRLLRAQVTEVEREGSNFRVTLDTAFGETVHVLSMPKQKDVTQYRGDIISSVEGRRREEMHFKFEPAEKMYEILKVSADGYDGDIPINHKSAVLTEVLGLTDETEEDVPEIEARENG
jgi:hypothetical protein